LKREYRLRGRDRFEEVRRHGKCWTHRLLVLCVSPNQLPGSCFGFSVSKRVGNSVTRNKVRRRLREIVRLRIPAIAPGWDVVLIARPPAAQAEFRQIENAVERLLLQSGLYETALASRSLSGDLSSALRQPGSSESF
jgi:ribonuclease P protein component